jgi:hypothetical protein
MQCNICGGTEWLDMSTRKAVRCETCSSLERTRALKLVLDYYGLLKKDAKILHFAPEKGLSAIFSKLSPQGYDPVDYNPEMYKYANARKFDMTKDLSSLPDNYYDLIVHVHVLEHIPMNIAPIMYHLHRAL